MNTKRKLLIALYAIIIFVMCIVYTPKTFYKISDNEFVSNRYGPIWGTVWSGGLYERYLYLKECRWEVDFVKLTLQIVGATTLFVPIYLILGEKKQSKNNEV